MTRTPSTRALGARTQAAWSSPARAAWARPRSRPRSAWRRPSAACARSWSSWATSAGCRRCSRRLGAGRRTSRDGPTRGDETALGENLWSVTIDPDRALLEWLQALGGRVPGRVLAGSGTFQYFAAAAPGAKELVSMVKVWELTRAERWRRRARRYDLVVLDAPATGHALGLLHSPRTFGAIARVGPIFGQAEQVRELLEDQRADRLSGGDPADGDGDRRDAGPAGRAALTARGGAGRGDRQRDAAAAASSGPSWRGSRAWTPARSRARVARSSARRCSPPGRCTSARACSTTRSRACAVTAWPCTRCRSCSRPSSTSTRYGGSASGWRSGV